MSFPVPIPGLVINYEYVWRDEHLRGIEHGRKARPCIIAGVQEDDFGKIRVTVWPIKHTPQEDPATSIDVPPRVAEHLALDDERQYIVTNQVNKFSWPGPDIQPARNDDYTYGEIPGALFRQVKDQFMELMSLGSASQVSREFDPIAEMERLKEERKNK